MTTSYKYQRLRDELARQNMSAMQLSFSARISASDLYNAMNGKKPFFPNWKKRVAEALGVPIEELFADEEE